MRARSTDPLGLTGAHQDAAASGAQRKDVAGADDVAGGGLGVNRRFNGSGAVSRRDAGADAGAGFNADGETGAVRRLIVGHHHRQAQLINNIRAHGQANQAAAVGGHKVDGLRGHHLCRHAEIALVFAVLVVNQNDHLSGFDVLHYLFYRTDCHIMPRCGNGRFAAVVPLAQPLQAHARRAILNQCLQKSVLGEKGRIDPAFRSNAGRLFRQQFFHIFADHIDFNVHPVALFQAAQGGDRQGVGDDGH